MTTRTRKRKCKFCPICETADFDLIRNCELRGGRYPTCVANSMPIDINDPAIIIDQRVVLVASEEK